MIDSKILQQNAHGRHTFYTAPFRLPSWVSSEEDSCAASQIITPRSIYEQRNKLEGTCAPPTVEAIPVDQVVEEAGERSEHEERVKAQQSELVRRNMQEQMERWRQHHQRQRDIKGYSGKPRGRNFTLVGCLLVLVPSIVVVVSVGVGCWLLWGRDFVGKLSAQPSGEKQIYDPPTVQTCLLIANGMPVDGQDQMIRKIFQLTMDVTVDSGYSFEIEFHTELKEKVQGLLMPVLAGCSHLRSNHVLRRQNQHLSLLKYLVGNAVADVTDSGNYSSNCDTNNNHMEQPCFPVMLDLNMFLKGEEEDTLSLIEKKIMEVFDGDDEPLVVKLGMEHPFVQIELAKVLIVHQNDPSESPVSSSPSPTASTLPPSPPTASPGTVACPDGDDDMAMYFAGGQYSKELGRLNGRYELDCHGGDTEIRALSRNSSDDCAIQCLGFLSPMDYEGDCHSGHRGGGGGASDRRDVAFILHGDYRNRTLFFGFALRDSVNKEIRCHRRMRLD